MKVNESQIQQLYVFTRQHFVEHYDLQTELVDHLANDIETIWKENPSLSFEQARDQSFKKFGVFGFMDVVTERSKALNKKYMKLVWQALKQFFKIPQITITALVFVSVYLLFEILSAEYVYIFLGVGCLVVLVYRMVKIRKIIKNRFQKTQKKWLLEGYILNMGNVALLFNVFIQMITIHRPKTLSDTSQFLITFLITSLILFAYIIMYYLPSRVEEILTKHYPEYKLT